MKPIIRAAVDSGRPPLELLLDEPDRPRSKWDGKLIKALYLAEAYEVEGHPIWVEESPDITFVAKSKIIRSQAVVERAQEAEGKKKNPPKGRRFYAEAVLAEGATWPTRKAWLEARMSEQGSQAPPPGSKLVSEAEERARKKVESDPELQALVAEIKAKRKSKGDKMD